MPMDLADLGEFRQWYQEDQTNRWVQHDAESKFGEAYRGTETLYGYKTELVNLIQTMKSKNVKCIADIVINHRGGQQLNAQNEKISWGGDEHRIASGKMVWGDHDNDPPEIANFNGGSGIDDGEGLFGTNIAHTDPKVRQEIKDWLKWLIDDIGYEAIRWDYVKGYAPGHIGEYNYHVGNPFSVGEC